MTNTSYPTPAPICPPKKFRIISYHIEQSLKLLEALNVGRVVKKITAKDLSFFDLLHEFLDREDSRIPGLTALETPIKSQI